MSCKRNSNRARPIDSQTTSPSPPADLDSEIVWVASIGESDGNSNYVELTKNSPTSLANTLDLAGHISELEEMHKVAEGDIMGIARPTVLLSRPNKLKIPELDNAKTNPP